MNIMSENLKKLVDKFTTELTSEEGAIDKVMSKLMNLGQDYVNQRIESFRGVELSPKSIKKWAIETKKQLNDAGKIKVYGLDRTIAIVEHKFPSVITMLLSAAKGSKSVLYETIAEDLRDTYGYAQRVKERLNKHRKRKDRADGLWGRIFRTKLIKADFDEVRALMELDHKIRSSLDSLIDMMEMVRNDNLDVDT